VAAEIREISRRSGVSWFVALAWGSCRGLNRGARATAPIIAGSRVKPRSRSRLVEACRHLGRHPDRGRWPRQSRSFAKAITAANAAANSDPAAVKQIMIKQDQVPAELARRSSSRRSVPPPCR
jgi:hypothetical protein